MCSKSVTEKYKQGFCHDWKKLGEDFYTEEFGYRCTPPSSPPEIWWSSSGSSDDQTVGSRTHHKVITKLDFDSCATYEKQKPRARVIRSVINSSRSVSMPGSGSSTQLCNSNNKFNINSVAVCDFKNANEDLILTSPSKLMNDTVNTSPLIGKRPPALCANNNLCGKEWQKNKIKRKDMSYNKKTSASPVIGLNKTKMNRCNLETKENVIGNTNCVEEDRMLFNESPVMYVSRKKSGNLKREILEIDVREEVSEIPEIPSPILGQSDKKTKHKKRKLIKRQKWRSLGKSSNLEHESKLAKICKNLFLEDSRDTENQIISDSNKRTDVVNDRVLVEREPVGSNNNSVKIHCENEDIVLKIHSGSSDLENVLNRLSRENDDSSLRSDDVNAESEENNKLLCQTGAGLEIETVSSQEVLNISVQEDTSVKVSSPSSCVISSCSTPPTGTSAIKSDPDEENARLYMDSARKRKKLRLNRCGLAARLKKLISRKESSRHIWKHEMKHMHTLNKGIVVTVISVWREYLCTLLHCAASSGKLVSPQSSELDDVNSIQNFGLVVVVETLPSFKLKPHSVLRIYPPWQTLSVPELKLTLILGVSFIEEIKETVNEHQNLKFVLEPQVIEHTAYNCSCECLQVSGEDAERRCKFKFPQHGLEFLEYLLPLNSLPGDSMKSESCVVREPGMIAEAVTKQGCLLTGDTALHLCVLNIFCYKSRNEGSGISWSILGCDSAGEYCEVVLGCEQDTTQSWRKVTTRQAIGHFFKFTGFKIAKRFQKSKNLGFCSLITRFLEKQDECEPEQKKLGENQLFIYVFAPGTETWTMEILDTSKPACLPKCEIHNLADALTKGRESIDRYSYLARLIWASASYLYVSDTSLYQDTVQNYIRILVINSCSLPPDVVSNKSDVVFLQDILFDKGVLSADKYSWIAPMSDVKQRCCPDVNDEVIDSLRNLHMIPAHLSPLSGTDDLVSFKGTVVCVDEETAFSWPVCELCDNELLLEVNSGQYLCQRCGSSQTRTRMSLQVYAKCQEMADTYKIKIKLLQDSILKLLPPSQDNDGYELSSVLGQPLGPLLCVVVKTAANCFFLNEIIV